MDWSTLFTAIGAILSAAGGCVILIREFRRRDRRVMKHELDDLTHEVRELRTNLIICRRYSFHLAEMMTENNMRIPYPEEWDKEEQETFEKQALEKRERERRLKEL